MSTTIANGFLCYLFELLGQIQQNSDCCAQDGNKDCEKQTGKPTKGFMHVFFDFNKGLRVLFCNRLKPCESFVGRDLCRINGGDAHGFPPYSRSFLPHLL